jgi:hypothetical protein
MDNAKAKFRPGQRDDAAVLADLVNYAGEGLPIYLWSKLAALGQTGWNVGRTRAARAAFHIGMQP